MRIQLASTVILFALAGIAAAQAPQVDVSYGPHEMNVLDLYSPIGQPFDAAPAPFVVFLHGSGAKKEGIGEKGLGQMLEILLWNNVAAASIEWRPYPQFIYPAQVDDAALAIQYLKAHAAEFELDHDKFMLWGSSAGAMIAGLLVYGPDYASGAGSAQDQESTRPLAFMNWGGLTNYTLMWPGYTGLFFGVQTISELLPAFLKGVSPAEMVLDVERQTTPPCQSFYGTIHDPLPLVNPHDILHMWDLHAKIGIESPAAASLSLMKQNLVHPNYEIEDIEELALWTVRRFGGTLPLVLGKAIGGTKGYPRVTPSGEFAAGGSIQLKVQSALPAASVAYLVVGAERVDLPLYGGTLVPAPQLILQVATDDRGIAVLDFDLPGSIADGGALYLQLWHADPAGSKGVAASAAHKVVFGQ